MVSQKIGNAAYALLKDQIFKSADFKRRGGFCLTKRQVNAKARNCEKAFGIPRTDYIALIHQLALDNDQLSPFAVDKK